MVQLLGGVITEHCRERMTSKSGAKDQPGLPLNGKSRCARGRCGLTAVPCTLGSELTSAVNVPFSRPPWMSQPLLRLSEETPSLGKNELQVIQLLLPGVSLPGCGSWRCLLRKISFKRALQPEPLAPCWGPAGPHRQRGRSTCSA